jgi:membrane-bound metal-dependent hydrolase YbcI (DUF457 family)
VKGRTHALSGAAAGLALARYTGGHDVAYVTLCGLLGGGTGLIPDWDHRQGTVAVTWGPLTRALTAVVAVLAQGHRKLTHSLPGTFMFSAVTLLLVELRDSAPGNGQWHLAVLWQPRELPLAILLALLIGTGLRALKVGDFAKEGFLGGANLIMSGLVGYVLAHSALDLRRLPLIVATGMLVHILGDMCTKGGCPLLYPFLDRDMWLLPEAMRWRVSDDKGFIAEKHVVAPLLWCAMLWYGWQLVAATGLFANFPISI